MARFQIFNAAGSGFNMSGVDANGWGFIEGDSSAQTYLLADNGATATYGIDTPTQDYAFEVDYRTSDGFNFLLENLRFYALPSGTPLLTAEGVDIVTTAADLASPSTFLKVNAEDDVWIGNDYVDIIKAGRGHDDVYGGVGNDNLYGEKGIDLLVGGLGRDTLSGGARTDVFDFNSTTETRVGTARDTITDFVSGLDVIDLRTIDANELKNKNQGFTWIKGERFHGEAGELRYSQGILSGDTDGNKRADFEIKVKVTDLDVTARLDTSDIWL